MAKGKQLTPVQPGALVVTIKAVFEVKDAAEVEEILENLQSQGAAAIVKREFVAESFREAADIVQAEALK